MAIAFVWSQLQGRLLSGGLSGGEDVIGPFLTDRKTYLDDTLRPLTEKDETLYVIPGSDAEEHAAKRFPNKKTKRVTSGIRPTSISGFLFGLKLLFQPGQAARLTATYHFTFTGDDVQLARFRLTKASCKFTAAMLASLTCE